MARIPGTAFHDADPPKPDVELLQQRVRFYESVMLHQSPHHHHGQRCKIADTNGLICCNPQCNGVWGTGCWCCHSLSFASEANAETMRLHLELKPYVKMDEYDRRAAPIIEVLEKYLAQPGQPGTPSVELRGRTWAVPDIIREIRDRTDEGRTWVAIGGLVRAALGAGAPKKPQCFCGAPSCDICHSS